MIYDSIVVGGGPCGLFAAFQLGMLSMRCAVVDQTHQLGGQCNMLYPLKPIYDIPAYPKILAQDLINKLVEQTKPFNHDYFLGEQVISYEKDDNGIFTVVTNKNKFLTKSIILAVGNGSFSPNKPPLDNIEKYEDKSVFYAVDDFEKFKDKNILIAGGGDSATDWALELSNIAKKIYLVHRRNKFKCAQSTLNKLLEISKSSDKLEIITPFQLSDIEGQDGYLKHVVIEDLDGNQQTLNIDVLIAFFGLKTDIQFISNWGLELENNNIIINPTTTQTNINGIYAIGDAAHYSNKIKLILTGFAEASIAAHHIYRNILGNKDKIEHSTTKGINKI